MNIIVLAVLSLFSPTLEAQQQCPVLPQGAPVHWRYDLWPESDQCYALADDDTLAFGLYRGNTPDFPWGHLVAAKAGAVAGKPVMWYTDEPGRNYYAILSINAGAGDGTRVFVPRNPEVTFVERLALVGNLSMRQPGAP